MHDSFEWSKASVRWGVSVLKPLPTSLLHLFGTRNFCYDRNRVYEAKGVTGRVFGGGGQDSSSGPGWVASPRGDGTRVLAFPTVLFLIRLP